MPSVPPVTAGRAVRRRDVLIGLIGSAGALGLAQLVSACGSDAPPPVDPLAAQSELAIADSELARAAATGASPAVAPALTQVASERSQHARALVEEIARAAGRPAPSTESTDASSSSSSAAPTTSTKPAPPPSASDVVAAVRRSADSAAQLAPTLSGYRAGLLGSIAASCTAAATVGLAIPKPAP